MVEHENVKDALKEAFDITKSGSVLMVEGKEASVEEVKALVEERLVNIADLLGLEHLYIKRGGVFK